MKASTILKRAAKLVEKGHCVGGCDAIWDAAHFTPYYLQRLDDSDRAFRIFEEYFYNATGEWFYEGFWWPEKMKHGPRIIALCLAAAIAKSEGD